MSLSQEDPIPNKMHHVVYVGGANSQGRDNKIGRTGDIKKRCVTMNTSYSRYTFNIILIIECKSEDESKDIEEYLHSYFVDFSTMNLPDQSGGTEWFDHQFTAKEIESALVEGGYPNVVIDGPEYIKSLNEKIRQTVREMHRETLKKIKNKTIRSRCTTCGPLPKINPRDYQSETLDKSREYYETHDKGLLEWPCGLGKTFESLLISQDYFRTSLMIGVYFVNLISQWLRSLKRFYPKIPILVVASSYPKNASYTSLNSSKSIQEWISRHKKNIIIVSYQSAHLFMGISKSLMIDFKIYDECHHLCSTQNEQQANGRRNTNILEIPSKKTLGLSATLKQVDDEGVHIDNSSKEHFGTPIDKKSIFWAIQNKHLCDYRMMTPSISLSDLEAMISENGDNGVKCEDYYMYLSAYLALESLNKYPHIKKLLIFCNRKENVRKVFAYIKKHLEVMDMAVPFIKSITDDNNVKESNDIIKEFGDAVGGILINITKVGEGIDIPSLDSVLFADEMNSEIRIIQSALRPCRIDPNNRDKVASLIIPMIFEAEEDESYGEESGDMKIRGYKTLTRLLREISDTDDNPILKIKSSLITRKGTQDDKKERGVFSMSDDIKLDRTIKMRIYHRNALGKNTLHHMKKIIQENGRRDPKLSLEDDFRRNKSGKFCLPDFDWVKSYLERRGYSWLDLYGYNLKDFYQWGEFKDKTRGLTMAQYHIMKENDSRLPLTVDLSPIYREHGYTRDYFDKNEITYDPDF